MQDNERIIETLNNTQRAIESIERLSMKSTATTAILMSLQQARTGLIDEITQDI